MNINVGTVIETQVGSKRTVKEIFVRDGETRLTLEGESRIGFFGGLKTWQISLHEQLAYLRRGEMTIIN